MSLFVAEAAVCYYAVPSSNGLLKDVEFGIDVVVCLMSLISINYYQLLHQL